MKRILLLVLTILLAVGCQEVLEPEIEESEPFLVVEGYISTLPGPYYVAVRYSNPYTEYPYFEGENNALVQIEDQEGNVYTLDLYSTGLYRLILDEESTPRVGDTYTLRIQTSSGDQYVSTPQQIVQSPEISGLMCDFDQNFVLAENAYGETYEIEQDGLNILLSTEGELPSDNYYLYDYLCYEQHHSVINYEINYYHIYRHRRLNGKYRTNLHTVNGDEYNNFRVWNDNLMFIVKSDFVSYIPPIPDTFTFISTAWEGLLFKLNQYSISPDVFRFYNDVENQLEASGRMFDPANPQIRGNITCVNDSSKIILGVFSARDVSVRYAYFYLNRRNQTYSRKLDSFPELWLDTCSWRQPASWVLPPI